MKAEVITQSYTEAKEALIEKGVDTEEILCQLHNAIADNLSSYALICSDDECKLQVKDIEKALLCIPLGRKYLKVASGQEGSIAVGEALTDVMRLQYTCQLIEKGRAKQKKLLSELISSYIDLSQTDCVEAVYDEFCVRNDVPVGEEYRFDLEQYISETTNS